jgi:hypothetical protein
VPRVALVMGSGRAPVVGCLVQGAGARYPMVDEDGVAALGTADVTRTGEAPSRTVGVESGSVSQVPRPTARTGASNRLHWDQSATDATAPMLVEVTRPLRARHLRGSAIVISWWSSEQGQWPRAI